MTEVYAGLDVSDKATHICLVGRGLSDWLSRLGNPGDRTKPLAILPPHLREIICRLKAAQDRGRVTDGSFNARCQTRRHRPLAVENLGNTGLRCADRLREGSSSHLSCRQDLDFEELARMGRVKIREELIVLDVLVALRGSHDCNIRE